jgi:AraC-like DNA-binding protein
MLVEAVRAWLKDQPEGSAGWLGALRDPSIGTALGLIHKAPEKQWTVPSLAAQVGMSRSPFAARFTALVGQAPMSYLKRWRLQLAAKLLQNQTLALSIIAEQVGYESTPAFSRVFKREFGMAPGQYRRSGTTSERTSGAEKHEAIPSNSRGGACEVHQTKAVSPAAN